MLGVYFRGEQTDVCSIGMGTTFDLLAACGNAFDVWRYWTVQSQLAQSWSNLNDRASTKNLNYFPTCTFNNSVYN